MVILVSVTSECNTNKQKTCTWKKINTLYGMLDRASVQLCINCVIIELIMQNISAVSSSEYWSTFWCSRCTPAVQQLNNLLILTSTLWSICQEWLVSSTKLCNSFRALENTYYVIKSFSSPYCTAGAIEWTDSTRKSKLTTSHTGVCCIPEVITHSPPLSSQVDLQSARCIRGRIQWPPCKPQITTSQSCKVVGCIIIV